MSKIDETIGFYRKMSDLQEKLRRSEEERLQLEEKFAVLMRSCHDDEEAKLNDLRERYEAFLQEEKQRRERNDKILQALDRIESRAAVLTAKSERLRLLRRHYEAYMLKMYPGWKYVTSKFTDDQPSTPKFDPSNNKLGLERDRNNSYTGPGSSSSLFPTDYRRVPLMLQHDHSTVGEISPGYQSVSVWRAIIDTTPATKTVDGLPLPSIARSTNNVIGPQQKLPSSVVTVGQHSVSQKKSPVCTKETFNSGKNIETGQINELDDYLRRAAEMLKLSRADENLSNTNVNTNASETNPEFKDTKHLGNSADFEFEQNTSGDILNVSLSDDGLLQEESNRTPLSFSQKVDQNKNIRLTKQVNNNGEVMKKRAQLVENVNNKDILLNKNGQAYLEEQNQETVKGCGDDAHNFKTALDNKGGGEFDNQRRLYQKNTTVMRGEDSVIPDKFPETEEQSGLSERKHENSVLDDEVQNHDDNFNGQKQIECVEISKENPKENYYVCEDSAVRQEKKDDTDESNAQGLMGNECEETPVNENIYTADGDEPVEEQWNENDQEYYQQYAEEQGDKYYQHVEGEYDQPYDEHDLNQEEERYYQEYGYQNVEQYDEQEGQYEQQADQYSKQDVQHEQQYADEQCDQHYEAYELLAEGQNVYEENRTAHREEDNQGLGNQEDTKEKCDETSEPLQRQQLEVKGDEQGSACDVSDTSLFEGGEYQEQVKVYQATESRSQGDGTTGPKEEKTLSNVVDDEIHDGSVLPKRPDLSSDLTQPSSSENVEQYRQLLGETGEPDQSDTDELEHQLAALVESQETGEKHGKQLLPSVSGEKMEKQTPGKVSTSVVENIGESTKTTESGKNMTERANRMDTETVGHAGTMHGNQEAQSKMLQTSSRPANEPVAIPEDAGTAKTTQMSIPRSGSKKLPGLTKMLESDTESLQLDATVSNEDSDDFDFSSDK